MKLTEHFTLDEFTRSQTATRMGREIEPEPHIITNLLALCEHVLEPARAEVNDALGHTGMIITSGYRPPWLNKAIGGSRTSDHMNGLAADVVFTNGRDLYDACRVIAQTDIPFDQLIYEGGRWMHISYRATPRRQILTATFKKCFLKPATLYQKGLVREA